FGSIDNVGSTYYVVGIASVAPVVEAVRIAAERLGEPVTVDKIRAALEEVSDFDLGGLMPPITITPQDHEGGGLGRISQWDGGRWVPVTDWMGAFRDVVWEMVYESSAQFRQGQ